MDWIDEAQLHLKKNNQVLFSKKSDYLQDLILLFQQQNHRTMALWAFGFAAETIEKLEEKYPKKHGRVKLWKPFKSGLQGELK